MARWNRALITGASAGIGEAFARELAGSGTNLIVVARRKDRLQALGAQLQERHGVEVEVIAADLVTTQGIEAVERRLEEDALPDIDLLVNNAGGSAGRGRGVFADHERGILEAQAMLNAVSVMRLTHAAVGTMRKRGSGNVIQVSAGTAFYPVPLGAVYAASKAFVNSFSQAVDFELRGSGVRVTVVCPGFTRTEAPARNGFTEENIPGWWWSGPEEVVDVALSGALRGKSVSSPKAVNKFNASFGRRFPRLMMRMSSGVARDD